MGMQYESLLTVIPLYSVAGASETVSIAIQQLAERTKSLHRPRAEAVSELATLATPITITAGRITIDRTLLTIAV